MSRRPAAIAAGLPARRAAVRLLTAVLHRHRPLDEALTASAADGPLSALSRRDRALSRAIVATALRRKGQIDDLLGRFLEKPLPERSAPATEILTAALAQLLFLDMPAHAVVDLAVRAARAGRASRPFASLVNAVLRRAVREGPAIVAAQDGPRLDTPEWLYGRWARAYGEDTARAIAAAHLDTPPLDLYVRDGRDAWAGRLGAHVTPTGSLRLGEAGPVEALDGFAEGAWWVQDAAAALPAALLGDVRGKRIADLCAAPGGKTAQLAASGAQVTAVDRAPARLARLEANLARLGLAAEIVCADVAAFEADEPFDAVLLDAPCTSTGTIRRHPDIPHLKDEADIARMAALQARLLERALELVRPGGLVVYCTCSLEPEEGEAVIEGALTGGAPAERVPVAARELGGCTEFVTAAGDLRTLPCHWRHLPEGLRGLDGFYASRLRRHPA